MMLRVLDLFSGIGGFSLGLERTGGFETVAFCEIEPFPRKVLQRHWPKVPCYEDIRTLSADSLGRDEISVDVICGGYPCQPFSSAGRREGKNDDRHLWPEFMRLVVELRPSWVIGENVAGHVSMGLDDVLSDLEGEGYTCRPFIIPACAVGAPHRRDRVWVIANTTSDRRAVSGGRNKGRNPNSPCRKQFWGELGGARTNDASRTMADSKCLGCGQVVASIIARKESEGSASQAEYCRCAGRWQRWLPEPDVGRVVNGVPRRVDRLRALGNSIVPQIPQIIGNAILQAEAQRKAAAA